MKKTFVKKNIWVCVILLQIFISGGRGNQLNAQKINPEILTKAWAAYWIGVPNAEPTGYGVYYFRKSLDILAVPSTFVVHVSADNRYKLFVNGSLVSLGPARGDLKHWNFETVNIARFLKNGRNIIAAQVWNEGRNKPEAQNTNQTAFILQGNTVSESLVNTNSSWKCIQDKSYLPIKIDMPTFYVAGAGEFIDMKDNQENWKDDLIDDSKWVEAKRISVGFPKNFSGYSRPNGWFLIPSGIPAMDYKQQRLHSLRKVEGISTLESFPKKSTQVKIPANRNVIFLLDQNFLTNAYLTLIFSQGKNSRIGLQYGESLFSKYPNKGHRNEIDGKYMLGRKDSLVSNGKDHQTFTSLTYRTYRYIQLTISTEDEPLIIDDIYGLTTNFPFELRAKLNTTNLEMQQMLEIGWRTALLCANETYMDCPYYEQLQYIGDTRIQALVSLYNSGDDRLLKNAINQFSNSQEPEGITQSRYPTTTPQYIPTFSLWYIGMLHDYLRYGKDTDFLKGKLNSMRQILNYFFQYQQPDGSVRNLPWWNFTDWVNTASWETGVRAKGKDGTSALLDFQLLYALQKAIDIEKAIGSKEFGAQFHQKAVFLEKSINRKYWVNSKQMFADRAEKDLFSQHTNALSILTGVVPGEFREKLVEHLLVDKTIAQASIYFKYYLHLALIESGNGNDYLKWLDIWRENIEMGLTTWGETSDVSSTRSDCHAWGASPNIEFFRTVLGVDSDGIAFKTVKIEPHLGDILKIGGEVPHPEGLIKVNYERHKSKIFSQIILPKGVSGRFIWQRKTFKLHEGENNFSLKE